MMKPVIFYSWQSDLPNSTNRSFIEKALSKAIEGVQSESKLELDLCLDRDTQNTSGAPDIADTICEKIENSSIFVGDVSIINQTNVTRLAFMKALFRTRLTSNPNVLIELGYAAHHLGWDNIICVFNTAYGKIEDLPFDLRKRRVLAYKITKASEKANERNRLARALQEALQSVVDNTTPLYRLKKEVFLEISLVCHEWKNSYMSLYPGHFRNVSGDFEDAWEMLIKVGSHNDSLEEWTRYHPLFVEAIDRIQNRLERILMQHGSLIPFNLKAEIISTIRQLSVEQIVYTSFGPGQVSVATRIRKTLSFLAVLDRSLKGQTAAPVVMYRG